jgi:selenocysteine lyase/cysteine desulfurase
MYKHFYKEFLKHNEKSVHLSAHSHHFWPDVTKDAVVKSWEDSAKYTDKKWGHIFSTIVPQAQQHIAKILNYSEPAQIAFAPNTHELLSRLLSVFLEKESLTILTTTSEFHSMSRQLKRILELDNVKAIILDNESEGFENKFLDAVTKVNFIYISHVFYNSGKVLQMNFIQKIIKKKSKETFFCLDGYHGFCAIPTDLSTIEQDVFYLSGGYKYAQAGEGACFMTIPKKYKLRPVNTGWFASMETLEKQPQTVHYSDNAMSFWGATQDLTPWYRFVFVWDLFEKEGLDVTIIDDYIKSLMSYFIENFTHKDLLMNEDLESLGHFLTLDLENSNEARSLHEKLEKHNIQTDFRDNRLRFGFGMYLAKDDLHKVMKTINESL